MTKASTFAFAAIIGGALFGLSTTAYADAKWWRAPATALDLPGAVQTCAALPDKPEGIDRIGCAITAILAGRTALARDQFLLVTDTEARDCVKQLAGTTRSAPQALTLMLAYCKAKLGSFADSRRLLATLKAPDDFAADTALRFEAFRVAILAHAVNGEGETDKAISLIKRHPQFPGSDILRATLFEIYVEDERRGELIAWWNTMKSGTFADASFRALCEAQIALVRGSPVQAQHVLADVHPAAQEDGSKALEVARFRVAQRTGHGKPASGPDKGRMSETLTAGPGYLNTNTMSQVGAGVGPFFVGARGVNFNIDNSKLNRPGVALPIGFFY